jgi:hypothetical protein
MVSGLFKDVRRGTRKLDRICREDPAAARALTEQDVCGLMRAKPIAISTAADGTRYLTWRQQEMTIAIVFKDHRFSRIYHRVHV